MRNSILLLASLVWFSGCSTAPSHSIDKEEANPNWRGQPFKKILVVGVSDDRGQRVSSESVFAAELSSKAVEAVPSYDVFPDLNMLDDKTTVMNKLRELGCDAAITVATVKDSYSDSSGWRAAESWLYALGADTRILRGSIAVGEYQSGNYSLEIGLWDAATLDSAWTATTKSYDLEDLTTSTKILADFLIDELAARGYI